MKKAIFTILILVLVLSLCACGPAQNDTPDTTPDTTPDNTQQTTVSGQLTWEKINAFPIKYPDMPISERRDLVVDFFNFSKTALWTPQEDFTFYLSSSETPYTLKAGTVYGGLPYMTVSGGNVYRLMDFMNESGQVDVAQYMREPADEKGIYGNAAMSLFGAQCSYAAYWAWARVSNSTDYNFTYHGVPKNNFILVGDYPDCGLDTLESWVPTTREDPDKIDNTVDVCRELGSQQMFENYAKMQKGDGMVYVTSGGHFIMCTSDPQVAYFADGSVNGDTSFVTISDQGSRWTERVSDDGQRFHHVGNVNAKVTFRYLHEHHYVPFTFEEFREGDILEETEVSFSHTGDTITKDQLFASKVTANYGISDIHVIVTDENSREVYRHIVRSEGPNKLEKDIIEEYFVNDDGIQMHVVDTKGALTAGTYNIKIEVQLGTGERPTVYAGKLVV